LRPADLPQNTRIRVLSFAKVRFSAILGAILPFHPATASSPFSVFCASVPRPQFVTVTFICTPVTPSCFGAQKHNRFKVKSFFHFRAMLAFLLRSIGV